MSGVQITFTAEDQDLLASYQRQQAEILKNQRALMRMGEAGKQSSDETSSGLGRVTQNLTSMIASYGLASRAVQALTQANRESIDAAVEAGKAWDDTFRKFRVQSGLRGLEAEQAQGRIVGAAERFAVPVPQAEAAARQLVSSGFAPDQASGQALDEVLSVLSASNIRGAQADPTELTLAISKFLSANNLDLTAENVARVGRPVQGLFRSTNVQLGQLGALSKEAPSFAQQMTPEEQLATFSSLVDVFQPEEAATGMRAVVSRLSTARETPTRMRALERLGIRPEEVDFVGEGAFDVFERLRQGIESAPEEERAGLLKLLFEERGVAPALTITQNLDEIRRRRDAIGGPGAEGQFLSDVAEATSGRNAAAVRQQVRHERYSAQRDQYDDLIREEIDTILREDPRLEDQPVDRWIRQFIFSRARDFGAEPEQAIRYALPTADPSIIQQRVEARMGSSSDQGGGEISRILREQLEVQQAIRNADRTRPPSGDLSRTH